ncbi:hypothetical protein DDZ14_07055 [Maritimibacter sp. 55A14]|uniref:metal-dependent hydrolase n=1 Tax=Maritimibacter sp. 55A14 TaxID=2174844 RepID=UPI000D609B98|nr:metal-dependent hydrolase [Maritimibacter sp. 55A14]PWE33161.1 hypothetical protein DDZ14_07055 [Maritimibacter sp. 55A14]
MMIAHLPSGYLLGRGVGARGGLMMAALAGAVLPDLDLAWYWLVDGGRIDHHLYWFHAPGFWLVLGLAGIAACRIFAHRLLPHATLLMAGVFLHLALDSVGGGIMWAWPFGERLYSLIDVPMAHGHFILSFMLHWSFAIELSITALAAALWLRARGAPAMVLRRRV